LLAPFIATATPGGTRAPPVAAPSAMLLAQASPETPTAAAAEAPTVVAPERLAELRVERQRLGAELREALAALRRVEADARQAAAATAGVRASAERPVPAVGVAP